MKKYSIEFYRAICRSSENEREKKRQRKDEKKITGVDIWYMVEIRYKWNSISSLDKLEINKTI